MTSQVETNIEELKAEAKSLGVKGWQLMKDPEKLQAKIDEAKAVEVAEAAPKRKAPPKMQVSFTGENKRRTLIERLEREDPTCKYLTKSNSFSPAEAKAKGFEIVRKENGDIMYCGDDIVVRTEKDSYYEWQRKRGEHATNAMKAIDPLLDTEGGGKKVQSLQERPKQGINPNG